MPGGVSSELDLSPPVGVGGRRKESDVVQGAAGRQESAEERRPRPEWAEEQEAER